MRWPETQRQTTKWPYGFLQEDMHASSMERDGHSIGFLFYTESNFLKHSTAFIKGKTVVQFDLVDRQPLDENRGLRASSVLKAIISIINHTASFSPPISELSFKYVMK